MDDIAQFDFPTDSPKIIKVIGVGGGGGNAVNHMYREGIHDVAFVVCNTDRKALEESPVPVKLQLGHEGLGAGNRPAKAKEATEESINEVQGMLNDGTKMVFITAGMGGGTGTGAAPTIARIAKEMDILTVGIVTIPFRWEGDKKIDQALDGVEEISKHVDALLVINNEKLGEIYPDLSVTSAFAKANDTLLIAAKSIAEIITMRGIINLDFNDVKTVMKDGGVAIMSTGYGEGESRVSEAIKNAQHSPLLNNNDIFNSKKVLLNISYSPDHELMMSEMDAVKDFMNRFNRDFETKFGMAEDPELEQKVKITLLATGFGIQDIHMKEMDDRITQRTAEAPCRTGGRGRAKTLTPRNLLRKGCQYQVSASAPPAYLYLQPRRPGQRRHHQHGGELPYLPARQEYPGGNQGQGGRSRHTRHRRSAGSRKRQQRHNHFLNRLPFRTSAGNSTL